jgi:uncharacterized protein YodC (DUF2158 family)
MQEKFKSGDTVMLNGGSEIMTVEEIREDGKVLCMWHSEDGYAQKEYYSEVCLNPS